MGQTEEIKQQLMMMKSYSAKRAEQERAFISGDGGEGFWKQVDVAAWARRMAATCAVGIVLVVAARCDWAGAEYLVAAWALLRKYRLAAWFWAVAGVCGAHRYKRRPGATVYLVDFSCYRAGDDQKCNYELSEYVTRSSQKFTLPSMDFQRKIFLRSGLGDETYIPSFIFSDLTNPRFADAREEAHQVMFGSVDDLLRKTGVSPSEISIIVSNCSLFTPTPSHSSMLANHLRVKEDCKTFHLAGMGCSASLIACKLAADLLKSCGRANQYALVVSTENITLNWYPGNEKAMLVTNCLFRVGCAAMLLSNRAADKGRAKYEFLHCVRTHKAADDRAYGCAFQREDDEGTLGVALNKNLMGVAAEALRTNIFSLAPLVLPVSEQARFAFSFVCRRFLKLKLKQYQPDFKTAVQHFCLHAGGRAVIDEIQKNLFLDDHHMEPSRATLHRWGNTSASCLWYVLAYMEAKERIKAGDRVWMLGLGSGFKCNSAILLALKDIPFSINSAWADCVHRYPGAHVLSSLKR